MSGYSAATCLQESTKRPHQALFEDHGVGNAAADVDQLDAVFRGEGAQVPVMLRCPEGFRRRVVIEDEAHSGRILHRGAGYEGKLLYGDGTVVVMDIEEIDSDIVHLPGENLPDAGV